MDEDSKLKRRIENIGLVFAMVVLFFAVLVVFLAIVAMTVGLWHFIAVYGP